MQNEHQLAMELMRPFGAMSTTRVRERRGLSLEMKITLKNILTTPSLSSSIFTFPSRIYALRFIFFTEY